MNKFEVTFSKNVDNDLANSLKEVLGNHRSLESEPYLSLPIAFGRNRSKELRGLIDKVRNRVQQWSSQILSTDGKEVLIKACVQAILIYNMSCFLFPKEVVHELNRLVAGF